MSAFVLVSQRLKRTLRENPASWERHDDETVYETGACHGGIVWKQTSGTVWRHEGIATMKSKLGAAILLSLLYAQGLLGIAAVAAVLMKQPAKERPAAQSAAVESLISVRRWRFAATKRVAVARLADAAGR